MYRLFKQDKYGPKTSSSSIIKCDRNQMRENVLLQLKVFIYADFLWNQTLVFALISLFCTSHIPLFAFKGTVSNINILRRIVPLIKFPPREQIKNGLNFAARTKEICLPSFWGIYGLYYFVLQTLILLKLWRKIMCFVVIFKYW